MILEDNKIYVIFFYNKKTLLSKIFRYFGNNKKYDPIHTGIILDNELYEAKLTKGTIKTNLEERLKKEKANYKIVEYPVSLTEKRKQILKDFLETKLNIEYSIIGAIASFEFKSKYLQFLNKFFDKTRNKIFEDGQYYFCSYFVADLHNFIKQSFKIKELQNIENPKECLPVDLEEFISNNQIVSINF